MRVVMSVREYCKVCGKCGKREVAIAVVPYSVEYDDEGQKIVVNIPDLSVPRCANCGTLSIDQDAANQIGEAYRNQIGLLAPDEIRTLRIDRGISQEELAERMGVPIPTVQRWESGGQIQSRIADKTLRVFFQQNHAYSGPARLEDCERYLAAVPNVEPPEHDRID